MRGEFIGVWSETRREIWSPLIDEPNGSEDGSLPEDIFCELYRALAPALSPSLSVEDLADIIDNPLQSREAFEKTLAKDIAGERALVGFFEEVRDALEEFGGEPAANRYFNLLSSFIEKFSLRYDLRRPCILCPTLPGMFAGLVRELDSLSTTDSNVAKRLRDFKEAVQDLRFGPTEGRIANCVTKQVMFLESVAAASGQIAGSDLGALCKELKHWPHPAVRQSLLNLYGFASDFPGVRHGGPSSGMKRDIQMRDMVAMSVLLTGFTPYLESRLNADAIFGGSVISAGPVSMGRSAEPDGPPNQLSKLAGIIGRFAFWKRG